MKVGISGYVGNKLTGIGRVLVDILLELSDLYPENKYIVFKNYDFEEYLILENKKNIQLVNIKVSKNSSLKNIIWHQWGFQSQLKKHDCDIAYIPNFSLLLWKKIPTIVTIHDLIEYNVPNKFSRLRMVYRKISDPLLAFRSDFVLTVSHSSRKDIIKYLHVKESKVLVTPNATNKNTFKLYDDELVKSVLSKYDLSFGEYLLFVGTIDFPGKNIKVLLEAFFELKKSKGISEKLVIIGKNGHNSDVVYDFVNSSSYKNDVIFTGYLHDKDLPYFYAGAKIMLYLSLYEGFGLPVLEAMSCGTPVVCSNTSCFPEMVEELDICVSPTNVAAIKDKIYKLLTDNLYRKNVAEQCYKKSLKYNWRDSAILYNQVFEDIIAKRNERIC
jgi:glycosyltransferase involved in cell wall biosynthesis